MKTIKLSRIKIYFIGLTVILMFIIINRVNFLVGSKFTTGEVIEIKSWTSRSIKAGGSYTAPIVKFIDQDYEITFQGETNDEYKVGDNVKVIYKSEDQSNAEIFSFVGFLLPSLLYSLIPLLLLTAATFSFIGSTDIVEISIEKMYKLSFKKEKMKSSSNNEEKH